MLLGPILNWMYRINELAHLLYVHVIDLYFMCDVLITIIGQTRIVLNAFVLLSLEHACEVVAGILMGYIIVKLFELPLFLKRFTQAVILVFKV